MNGVSCDTRGSTLLETVAALAVAALVAAGAAAGVAPLAAQAQLAAARGSVVTALRAARAQAAWRAETVEVMLADDRVGPTRGGSGTTLAAAFPLPPGVVVTSGPSRGAVRFFASGLADNTTIVLGNPRASAAPIVVNQRGLLR